MSCNFVYVTTISGVFTTTKKKIIMTVTLISFFNTF